MADIKVSQSLDVFPKTISMENGTSCLLQPKQGSRLHDLVKHPRCQNFTKSEKIEILYQGLPRCAFLSGDRVVNQKLRNSFLEQEQKENISLSVDAFIDLDDTTIAFRDRGVRVGHPLIDKRTQLPVTLANPLCENRLEKLLVGTGEVKKDYYSLYAYSLTSPFFVQNQAIFDLALESPFQIQEGAASLLGLHVLTARGDMTEEELNRYRAEKPATLAVRNFSPLPGNLEMYHTDENCSRSLNPNGIGNLLSVFATRYPAPFEVSGLLKSLWKYLFDGEYPSDLDKPLVLLAFGEEKAVLKENKNYPSKIVYIDNHDQYFKLLPDLFTEPVLKNLNSSNIHYYFILVRPNTENNTFAHYLVGSTTEKLRGGRKASFDPNDIPPDCLPETDKTLSPANLLNNKPPDNAVKIDPVQFIRAMRSGKVEEYIQGCH